MAKKQVSADNYFAIVPEWVIYSDISANAIRLYCVLARHSDKDTGDCFPSRNTLMDLSRQSKATLSASTKELVKIGAVIVTRRYGEDGKDYLSNLYKIITQNPHPSSEIEQGACSDNEKPLSNPRTSPSAESDPLTRVIINQSQLTKEKIKSEVEQSSPEISEICFYLAKAIETRGLKPRPLEQVINGVKWRSEARLLLRGRIGHKDTLEDSGALTVSQIKAAIDYAMNDSFWATVIFSPAALRRDYPRLRMQAQSGKERRQPKGLSAIQQIREEESRKAIQNAIN